MRTLASPGQKANNNPTLFLCISVHSVVIFWPKTSEFSSPSVAILCLKYVEIHAICGQLFLTNEPNLKIRKNIVTVFIRETNNYSPVTGDYKNEPNRTQIFSVNLCAPCGKIGGYEWDSNKSSGISNESLSFSRSESDWTEAARLFRLRRSW